MRKLRKNWPTLTLAATVVLAGWGIRSAAAQDVPAFDIRMAQPIDFNVLMKQMPNPARYVFFKQVGTQESGFWIGVATEAASDTLRSQLGLEQDHGLVVRDVAPDGPAAKAGLKQHDVLFTAGDTLLKQVEDLVAAVNQAESVQLKLYRGGKQISLEVTPVQRPANTVREFPQLPPEFRNLMEQNAQRAGPMQFRFVGPGMLMHRSKLPKNVAVSVTRQGDEPAKITVKRGDESWEVTEEDLDKLPEDLREPIREMLRFGLTGNVKFQDFDFKFMGPDQLPPNVRQQIKQLPNVRVERDGIRTSSKPDDKVQQQMDELRAELTELRKALKSHHEERQALLKALQQMLDKSND